MMLKGQRRAELAGDYVDMRTGDSFWIAGVRKNGEDHHWAGSGKILVEAAAATGGFDSGVLTDFGEVKTISESK